MGFDEGFLRESVTDSEVVSSERTEISGHIALSIQLVSLLECILSLLVSLEENFGERVMGYIRTNNARRGAYLLANFDTLHKFQR